MAVINILKDGTVVDDMSKITIPDEIMKNIISVYKNRGNRNICIPKKAKEKKNDS